MYVCKCSWASKKNCEIFVLLLKDVDLTTHSSILEDSVDCIPVLGSSLNLL